MAIELIYFTKTLRRYGVAQYKTQRKINIEVLRKQLIEKYRLGQLPGNLRKGRIYTIFVYTPHRIENGYYILQDELNGGYARDKKNMRYKKNWTPGKVYE